MRWRMFGNVRWRMFGSVRRRAEDVRWRMLGSVRWRMPESHLAGEFRAMRA